MREQTPAPIEFRERQEELLRQPEEEQVDPTTGGAPEAADARPALQQALNPARLVRLVFQLLEDEEAN